MKKGLLSVILASAMASTVAYCGSNAGYQNVQSGEVYFNEEQFAGLYVDQVVTTFPLVYKGSMKLDGVEGISESSFDSCMIYKDKPAATLYLTMCQGAISSTLCQNVQMPLRNPEMFSGIGAANYDSDSVDNETMVAFGDGYTKPVVSSMNLYVVLSASDMKKTLAKLQKRDYTPGKPGDLYYFVETGKNVVLAENLMDDIFMAKSAPGQLMRKSVSFFTGAEKNGAILDLNYDMMMVSPRNKKRRYSDAVISMRMQLVGKKGRYNFRYNPGEYLVEDISCKEDSDYRSGWWRMADAKAQTAKIDCIKSFSGKFHAYVFSEITSDERKLTDMPEPKVVPESSVGSIFIGGTVKLTLNSVTKNVARKIFGGDEDNALLSNPTICEEGLAFLDDDNDGTDHSMNAFEELVWGGKKADKHLIDRASGMAGAQLYMVMCYFDVAVGI